MLPESVPLQLSVRPFSQTPVQLINQINVSLPRVDVLSVQLDSNCSVLSLCTRLLADPSRLVSGIQPRDRE